VYAYIVCCLAVYIHIHTTIATDNCSVCLSVCLSRGLNQQRRVQCTPCARVIRCSLWPLVYNRKTNLISYQFVGIKLPESIVKQEMRLLANPHGRVTQQRRRHETDKWWRRQQIIHLNHRVHTDIKILFSMTFQDLQRPNSKVFQDSKKNRIHCK